MILSPVVCALRPDQRTTAMNWLHSFYCVGATLTILVATFALAWGIGWHALAFALLAIPAVIGILFLIIPLPRLTAEDQQRLRVRDMIFDRYFLLLLAAIFFGGATEMGMAQWLPSFAELDLKMSAGVGGMALLAFSLAMALARMVVGSVSHGIPMRHVMIGACASTAVLLVACGICPVADVALAAAILSGFTGSCLWPSTLGLAGDRYPLAGASMFGILAAAGSLGGVIMPWGVGLVADHGTIALGLAVSALCPVLMLVCLVLLGKGSPTVAPAALPLPPMA
jgi:fucose permease